MVLRPHLLPVENHRDTVHRRIDCVGVSQRPLVIRWKYLVVGSQVQEDRRQFEGVFPLVKLLPEKAG